MGGSAEFSLHDLVFTGPAASSVCVKLPLTVSVPLFVSDPSGDAWTVAVFLQGRGIFGPNGAGIGGVAGIAPTQFISNDNVQVSLGTNGRTDFQNFQIRLDVTSRTSQGSTTVPAIDAEVNLGGPACNNNVFQFVDCTTGLSVSGYSASSVSGGITDNRFATGCPPHPDSTPAVTLTAAAPRTALEGATAQRVFTLTRTGNAAAPTTVGLSTSGSAQPSSPGHPGADFQVLPASYTFPIGVATKSFDLVAFADPNVELDETVTLTALSGSGYTLGTPSSATVTILDNTPPPLVSLGACSAVESDTRTVTMRCPVNLSGTSYLPIAVTGTTATTGTNFNGLPVTATATSGSTCSSTVDFTTTAFSLSFPSGALAAQAEIPICGDTRREANEFFFLKMTGATNASLGCGTHCSLFGTATIVDNDLVTGSLSLEPAEATLGAHDRLPLTITWTVPDPLSWHVLDDLDIRIRDGADTAIAVHWEEAGNTLSLVNDVTGRLGKAFAPGSPNRLETDEATLYLRDAAVQGSGPTGPSVTLTLPLSFKPRASGHTFVVEVAASDDLGHHDDFVEAGTVTVAASHDDEGGRP
ncbi:MAG TPA: hypothetical protein VJ826_14205 [Candidatus Polarisedimenticolaceae bacterium]|nr:hypothetical protein [Candidatus Polarisedimenticolaceae bacterium]